MMRGAVAMTPEDRDRHIRAIIEREGGWVDDPDDSGGPTNYGITLAMWREYCKSGDPALMETLLAYNAADVLALPVLLAHAINELLSTTPFAARFEVPIPRPGHNPHVPDAGVLHRLAWAFSRK